MAFSADEIAEDPALHHLIRSQAKALAHARLANAAMPQCECSRGFHHKHMGTQAVKLAIIPDAFEQSLTAA